MRPKFFGILLLAALVLPSVADAQLIRGAVTTEEFARQIFILRTAAEWRALLGVAAGNSATNVVWPIAGTNTIARTNGLTVAIDVTNFPAAQLTGTIPQTALPPGVLTNNHVPPVFVNKFDSTNITSTNLSVTSGSRVPIGDNFRNAGAPAGAYINFLGGSVAGASDLPPIGKEVWAAQPYPYITFTPGVSATVETDNLLSTTENNTTNFIATFLTVPAFTVLTNDPRVKLAMLWDDGWKATNRSAGQLFQSHPTRMPSGVSAVVSYAHARSFEVIPFAYAGPYYLKPGATEVDLPPITFLGSQVFQKGLEANPNGSNPIEPLITVDWVHKDVNWFYSQGFDGYAIQYVEDLRQWAGDDLVRLRQFPNASIYPSVAQNGIDVFSWRQDYPTRSHQMLTWLMYEAPLNPAIGYACNTFLFGSGTGTVEPNAASGVSFAISQIRPIWSQLKEFPEKGAFTTFFWENTSYLPQSMTYNDWKSYLSLAAMFHANNSFVYQNPSLTPAGFWFTNAMFNNTITNLAVRELAYDDARRWPFLISSSTTNVGGFGGTNSVWGCWYTNGLAVCFVNQSGTAATNLTVTAGQMGLKSNVFFNVYDTWSNNVYIGPFTNTFTATIPAASAYLLTFVPGINSTNLSSIPLSSIDRSGAALNQVPVWNGAAWAPQNQTGGGGGAATNAVGTILSNNVIKVTGATNLNFASDFAVTNNPGGSGTADVGLSPSGVTAGTYTKVTIDAKGRATAGATATLASSDFFGQGTAGTVLHANGAAANPSWSAVDVAGAEIFGVLKTAALPAFTGAITTPGASLSTSLGSFTSANLKAALTDETGGGASVFADSPVFTTQITAPKIVYSGTLIETFGSGSPESVVTAAVGSVFHRTDGAASTTLYVKESGSGNVGWVAHGAGGGSGSPGGVNTQIQYNNVGVFGGAAQMLYNVANDWTVFTNRFAVGTNSIDTTNIFQIASRTNKTVLEAGFDSIVRVGYQLNVGAGAAATTSYMTNGGAYFPNPIVTDSYIDIGSSTPGVRIGGTNGVVTFTALFGQLESIHLDLAATANTGTFTSESGLNVLDFVGITLRQDGVAMLSVSSIDTSAELAAILTDETGSGGGFVRATSPTLTTPIIGVASGTSLALTGTAGAGFVEYPTQSSVPSAPATGYREYADSTGRRAWIRASDGFTRTWDATLTANRIYTLPDAASTFPIASQQITFAGPSAARTYTFPDANATIARTDAANTFTGHQTIEGVTSTGATGTGKFVFDTTPTLVTPVLGVATGTSFNKWVFTAPTTSATLTAGADGLTYTMPAATDTIVGRASTDTLSNKTLASPIITGVATASQVNYTTNLSTMAPDFNLSYTLITTNAAFTVLLPINIDNNLAQTTVFAVTNTTAAPVIITPPANVHVQGTWYVTNLTEITFHKYGSKFTNAVALPMW